MKFMWEHNYESYWFLYVHDEGRFDFRRISKYHVRKSMVNYYVMCDADNDSGESKCSAPFKTLDEAQAYAVTLHKLEFGN